jgi:CBS domain-containing protein
VVSGAPGSLVGTTSTAAHTEESTVRARQLAEDFPTVSLTSDAMAAARAMAESAKPGLIVVDENGGPHAVLGGSQVLRFVIPRYVQDDPPLARALDSDAADELCRRLERRTVRELLPAPQDRDELPVVDRDATALEMAAVMARMHSPLVAVVEDGRVVGAVTAARLLHHLLPSESANPDAM